MPLVNARILSLIITLLLSARLFAQDIFPVNNNLGFRAGAVLAFGTHFQRLGLVFNFYYVHQQLQTNSEVRIYYNFRSPGPPLKHPELLLSQGIVFAYGAQRDSLNPFVSSVSNQTRHKNCVAYTYSTWFNTIKTSQQTGMLHFGTGNFSFIIQNDLFARPALDRFRTGALLLRYRYNDLAEYGLSCRLWTGQYKRKAFISGIPAFSNDSYMDTVNGIYTAYSHGMLSAQINYLLPHFQYASAEAGIDAEQVRDFLQNRFLHNMRFIPQAWLKRKNCHLPMTDTNGGPYLGPAEKLPFLGLAG